MTAALPPIRFFLDEGVPHSVGKVLEEAGHSVIYPKAWANQGVPDPVVCEMALANDAVLVALDGDMRAIAKGHGIGNDRFARLSLLKLSCDEPDAANRVRQAMTLIEHEYRQPGARERRMFVDIGRAVMRTIR